MGKKAETRAKLVRFSHRFSRSRAKTRWVRFTGERLTYVGRTETERKPFQYRVTLQHVERTQQNPYGLVVAVVEQADILKSRE